MSKTVDSSTKLIIEAARQRSIKDEPLKADPNLVVLTQGDHRELIYYSSNDKVGRATAKTFLLKPATDELLHRGGFPAPAEQLASSASEVTAFLKKYTKIVVKPVDSVWGQGVTPGITREAEVEPALTLARSFNNSRSEQRVVCQQHIDGEEYRILVINFTHVFAVHRIPAHVVGDGSTSVQQLIDLWNQQVPADRHIVMSDAVEALLKEQGSSLTDIPPSGTRVRLKRVANAHAGGIVHDATDVIGSHARQTSIAIAKYFQAPLVGVDCISPDIRTTIGHVIELNSTPDITLHHAPTAGQSRPVADAIVDMLFPETAAQA